MLSRAHGLRPARDLILTCGRRRRRPFSHPRTPSSVCHFDRPNGKISNGTRVSSTTLVPRASKNVHCPQKRRTKQNISIDSRRRRRLSIVTASHLSSIMKKKNKTVPSCLRDAILDQLFLLLLLLLSLLLLLLYFLNICHSRCGSGLVR